MLPSLELLCLSTWTSFGRPSRRASTRAFFLLRNLNLFQEWGCRVLSTRFGRRLLLRRDLAHLRQTRGLHRLLVDLRLIQTLEWVQACSIVVTCELPHCLWRGGNRRSVAFPRTFGPARGKQAHRHLLLRRQALAPRPLQSGSPDDLQLFPYRDCLVLCILNWCVALCQHDPTFSPECV